MTINDDIQDSRIYDYVAEEAEQEKDEEAYCEAMDWLMDAERDERR
jgi:hypothetical protein